MNGTDFMRQDRILFSKKSPKSRKEDVADKLFDDQFRRLLMEHMAVFELPAEKSFEIYRKILAVAHLAISKSS